MPRPERKQGGGTSALPPGATSYHGIIRLKNGRFQARATRNFATLDEAREWRASIVPPPDPCPVCGREVVSPQKVYCSSRCAAEAEREQERDRTRTAPPGTVTFRGVEQNIRSNGATFKVAVRINGVKHIRSFTDLEGARAYRDKLLARQQAARTKACLECGTVFLAPLTGGKSYCSRECGIAALRKGVLVKPARALPSTRRRAREAEKARIQAIKVEILSGPGTFADAYRDVQEILRKHVEKEARS